MASSDQVQRRIQQYGVLRQELIRDLGPLLSERPEAAEGIARFFDTLEERVQKKQTRACRRRPMAAWRSSSAWARKPLGGIAGAFQPAGIKEYDDEVAPERILAVGDLYYIYQHERLGVVPSRARTAAAFHCRRHPPIHRSRGLRPPPVRPAAGASLHGGGRESRRIGGVFDYTSTPPAPGARPNAAFHSLFVQFVTSVAEFFRDKRVSEVIRPRATDPSFGSIAVVRRAGLDLRNNLEQVILRARQCSVASTRSNCLNEAFQILGSDDVMNLFGASNAWDVLEEVMPPLSGRVTGCCVSSAIAWGGNWTQHSPLAGVALHPQYVPQWLRDRSHQDWRRRRRVGNQCRSGRRRGRANSLQTALGSCPFADQSPAAGPGFGSSAATQRPVSSQ